MSQECSKDQMTPGMVKRERLIINQLEKTVPTLKELMGIGEKFKTYNNGG